MSRLSEIFVQRSVNHRSHNRHSLCEVIVVHVCRDDTYDPSTGKFVPGEQSFHSQLSRMLCKRAEVKLCLYCEVCS